MRTRHLTLGGLSVALVAVATLVIRIPVPATQGYINLGETMVYLTALLLGPVSGAVAGGVGSALADLLAGYTAFAPFTLVIKGIEGGLCGWLAWRVFRWGEGKGGRWLVGGVVASGVAGVWMVLGYYVTEAYLMGLGPGAAAAEVPGNLFQVGSGIVVGIPAAALLRRSVLRPA
ncbi:MAG: ECF transporter S component [Armatimonadetes bacterium]|nr:ECF transporter S component [Armatimonadota bacterium]MDW8153435.1 ECF transporter S component [Armatimonadota bacterium]